MKKVYLLVMSGLFSTMIIAQTKQEAIIKTMNERYESAADDFRKLIKASPADGELYFYAGDNYLYWGELDSAQNMYSAGMNADPLNPLNYAGLGRVAWMKNDVSSNKTYYDKAIGIISNKSNKIDKNIQQVTYLKMAEAYIQSEAKKLDEAVAYINTAIKLNDRDAESYVQLGDYYSEKDGFNLSNAIQQYNKALELNPKYTRTLLRKGILYVKVKNWDEGISLFNRAIEIDPTFAPAYREKAELLYKAGRYKPAIEAYDKYLELNNSCRVQQRYASFVFLTNDFDKAIEELEKATPCDPSNGIMYRLLGYSYYETGDFQKGLENMDKFFAISEKYGKPTILGSDYAYKGKLLAKAGKDSLGIELIKSAIDKDPGYIDGYGEIATLYSKARKNGLAAEWFKKKIEHSENPSALDYYYLGQSYYFDKNYAASDSAFAKATDRYFDAWFWRARCNSKLDNPEMPTGLAKPFFETAIQKVGTDPADIEANKKSLIEAYSYLGFFYFTQSNFDCSKAAWLKIIEMDATSEKAKTALSDEKIIGATGECGLIAAP
ncbi:MAG: tetratricopeptide repeat protein [Crocinitomicaceae bacterium]|nr:tetratricopeptide repeat protein [Crocinitomicaceae bacterium]